MAMRPFGFPLKIRKGGNILPLAVTVATRVIPFVSLVDALVWTVLAPLAFRVLFE
jgi:hypothetical protein